MRSLRRFRNSQQVFAQGVKIPQPFAFLVVRHIAICSKIVDYISGHKQFDGASAISNFKKILRLEQLKDNKSAVSSIESRLLGDKFCCQRRRCCYTTFSFGIQNECYMSQCKYSKSKNCKERQAAQLSLKPVQNLCKPRYT